MVKGSCRRMDKFISPNSCASNGPKGDCAATSCTIFPNGDTNGIGESNTNANTITAYM